MKNYSHLSNIDKIDEVLNNFQNDNSVCKEIGDRVVVVDYSSCTDLNGQTLDSKADEDMQFNPLTYFIVIDTQKKINYKTFYTTYRQDLIIVNPLTKKQFRINSGHVILK